MKRYCFALDLNNDPALIAEYEGIHKQIWPEIKKSILDAGITTMDIYRVGDRMFMIMETTDDFEFENKERMDAANPIVKKWEEFMWKFQKPLSFAKQGEKWVLMKQIFQL